MTAKTPKFEKYFYPVKILEGHLDYFGHVNHAQYLVLFEEARWDMITHRGYGLKRIQETGMAPIVLEVNLKFRRELRLRKEVIIETEIVSYEKKIATLCQAIKDHENRLYCAAEFKCGLFDLQKRKLCQPTPEWLKALGLTDS